MDRYLGSRFVELSGGNTWISTVIIVVLVGVRIVGPIVVRRMRKIRGPVQTGTAQVLSLKQFGSVAVNCPARQMCRFRLRAEVPGRGPGRPVTPIRRGLAGALIDSVTF